MTPKPKAEGAEQQSAEHEKTGNEQTPSPTEVVSSPEIDEHYFEQNVAYENTDNDDDYDDGVATDEAAAIAEFMAEAAAQNTTVHCHIGAKRQREDAAQPEVPRQVT